MDLETTQRAIQGEPAEVPGGWVEVARGLRWRKPLPAGYASVVLDFDSPPRAQHYQLHICRVGEKPVTVPIAGLARAFEVAEKILSGALMVYAPGRSLLRTRCIPAAGFVRAASAGTAPATGGR